MGPTPQLEYIQIDAITIGAQQIRADLTDDALEELALDIQAHGMLQPIGVRPIDAANYQLLWGQRRWRAHKLLRRSHILAKIEHGTLDGLKSIAIRENIHRTNMTLREECDAVTHLHDVEHRTPDEIRATLAKSRAWVMTRLTIQSMPADLQEALWDERIPIGHAEQIAQVADPNVRSQLIQHSVNERWSLAILKTAINTYAQQPDIGPALAAGAAAHAERSAPTPLHAACALCGIIQPLTALLLTRVCANGCPEPTSPDSSPSSS